MFDDVVRDASYAGSAIRGEVLAVGRRRFWRDGGELLIITSVGISRATVAQRHEVTRQQIYKWRQELMIKGLWSSEAGALFSR